LIPVGPEIELAEVTAGYPRRLRRRRAVGPLSLRVAAGSVVAWVGPNGAGKTTLFHLLLGFAPVHSGRVLIDGHSPASYRKRRGVGYLPEGVALPAGWTVAGLVEAGHILSKGGRPGRRRLGPPHGEAARRRRVEVPALLLGLGLAGASATPVTHLSRGQARRTALAYALSGEPGLVLLDEPWSGLDPEARSLVRGLVRALREDGRTVCIASHEVSEVERVADVVHLLRDGRLERTVHAAAWAAEGLEPFVLGKAGEGPGRAAHRGA
jgi:ABC-type multidrug transport system ATPase subunit